MRAKGRWCGSALVLAAACLAGCAGNGKGLDQNGQPIGTGGASSGPITADFQSIQDNVFTPICSKCHIGASAPEGLQLDAAHSYNLLVGVPSAEEPSLLRVKPSDPDNSYMVRKIEGASGILGGQMPLGETPLPQGTIDAIRQWITNGAPNAATASASAFAVQSTSPADKAIVRTPLTHVVVAFTQEVDASLVNESTVSLERVSESCALDGVDAAACGGDPADIATKLAAAGVLAPLNPSVILITPSVPLSAGTYRITVRGVGGGAIANLNAAPLGSNASAVFTVESDQ
jgi:hypothetical protein